MSQHESKPISSTAAPATTPTLFLPGDGTRVIVEVKYIADGFARDADSLCAFCHGDPCAEDADPQSEIVKYFARNKRAQTCPMCGGRPS